MGERDNLAAAAAGRVTNGRATVTPDPGEQPATGEEEKQQAELMQQPEAQVWANYGPGPICGPVGFSRQHRTREEMI